MPKIVGKYKIIGTLGKGNLSEVKYAINIKNDKQYAMKVIDLSYIRNPRMEAQIKHRINIMEKMDHPGIVKLRDIMHSKRYMFLVFDLEQGDFFDIVAQGGAIPEDMARKYFHQLIDIIDYMHQNNAVHRDLKAENLLVDAEGNLVITDFIFSNMTKEPLTDIEKVKDDIESDLSDTETETEAEAENDADSNIQNSTPINETLRHFSAPEALHEEGYIPEVADIWSAGVILYLMLVGDFPFDAPTPKELEEKIREAHVSFPAKFPPKAQNLLKRIFVAEPEKRCTMQELKRHSWFKEDYTPIVGGKIDNTIVGGEIDNIIEDKEVTVHLSADTKVNHRDVDINEPINVFELIAKLSGVSIDGLVNQKTRSNNVTSFTTSKSVTELRDLIKNTLTCIGAKIFKKSTAKVVRANIPICSKEVGIKLEISKLTDDLSLVEISRRKGSQTDYMRVYKVFKNKLK